MTKLEITLQQVQQQKRMALMTHVVIGYPSLEHTIKIVKTMAENGADIIEMQIPFSDPLADGPTIMRACEKSLENGTKVKDAFIIMNELSSKVSTPLLFMAYYNNIFKYGVERFCKDAKAAGASGLIVPDLPVDEEREEHFIFFCRKYALHNIQVVSPVSTRDRLKKNAEVESGFIYCTARQGTTGAKDKLDPKLSIYLKKMRTFFSVPIAVGFGISTKKHIEMLAHHADIAVVGSAIIDVIHSSHPDDLNKNIQLYLNDIKV